MNFEEQITAAIDISENHEHSMLVNTLIDGKIDTYVIGKNDQSLEIIKRYKVCGLIDDYSASGKYWNGVPVVQARDVDPSSIVINCVFGFCYRSLAKYSIGCSLNHNTLV
jgi:hypothetical protein